MNEKYKEHEDKKKRPRVVKVKKIVMVHLNKQILPHGFTKLQNKKYDPFTTLQKINDNC